MTVETEYEVQIELSNGVELKFSAHWDGTKTVQMWVGTEGPFPISDGDIHLLVHTLTNLDRVVHQDCGE
jgi:hypothetical protein